MLKSKFNRKRALNSLKLRILGIDFDCIDSHTHCKNKKRVKLILKLKLELRQYLKFSLT